MIQYQKWKDEIRILITDEQNHGSVVKLDEAVDFSDCVSNYRIKPGPKYRPFIDNKECWNEMLKHQPFGWVRTMNAYN